MKITPISAIGDARGPCEHKVRVAANPTRASQYASYLRRKKGVPEDQCGTRSDFTVDGAPMCRAHAGQMALHHLVERTA